MRYHRLPFTLPGVLLLLAACSVTPPSRPPLPASADAHLLMGEIALARGRGDVALNEYLQAADKVDDPAVARRATLVAVMVNDIAAAHHATDRWQQLAPGDIEMAQYQAILHARADELEKALRYLVRVADGDTGEAVGANLQMITSMLAAESNHWRSATLMAELARARPAHAEGWYGAALLALQADRPASAVAFANRALERDPNLLDAMFLKARAQLLLLPGEAETDKILRPLAGFRHAADPGQRYRFAGLLVAAGRGDEADALYEDILVADPDQHDARVARALLALDAGRLEVADEELHTLLARHGRVQDALFYLGAVAEQRGALNEAVDWYARVSPQVARWLDAQAAIGRVVLERDGPEATVELFTTLRQLWPEQSAPLLLQEAALLTQYGEPALALQLLEREGVAALHPELRWQLALAAAETGQFDRAENALRELLETDPRNPALQNALGYLLVEQGERLEAAEALLQSAVASAPANAAFLDSLGWLRFKQERFDEARRLLEESWQREPSVATGLHLLTTLQLLDVVAASDFRVRLRARFPHLKDQGEES